MGGDGDRSFEHIGRSLSSSSTTNTSSSSLEWLRPMCPSNSPYLARLSCRNKEVFSEMHRKKHEQEIQFAFHILIQTFKKPSSVCVALVIRLIFSAVSSISSFAQDSCPLATPHNHHQNSKFRCSKTSFFMQYYK